MIVILKPEVTPESPEFRKIYDYFARFEGIKLRVAQYEGVSRKVIEIHLIGDTQKVPLEEVQALPGVEKAIRVSAKYRQIGRHGSLEPFGFEYQGLKFDQDSFHVFAGLCAVDSKENAETIFKALSENGVVTARMGAYKPRTSPYDFQGFGKECLPWLFELAGKYGIKVIAMEVLSPHHIDEIREALEKTGHPTGVMLQIGTRNAQNFELLRAVGSQTEFPVLYKRGMGLSIEESLNACEYIASEGNHKIIFCLRGVRTHLGDPHRNLVDFGHVPVIKRQTRLPVCVDPSHPIGSRVAAPDGIKDIYHVAAQGVIAGANMVLVEFHPKPEEALCDGPQALQLEELPWFLEHVNLAREAYLKMRELVSKYS
ncbi:3-deoxy-7-phosphoheptulonate synthase [Thermosulfurimonas dismutans]|uniref:2-keto-3-deoxy-D-arabino-heptulosonate-7-phosphate synthase I beta n=1 Tax=Thermosulfurimonas dismutans TaxID=999894 RepID=A0A179D415_9BACT|nr:3-deoxy-7-phosphoheptulonate synthase [Thermosulfurimonas dismutans]OAQ20824.1 2-keto-3-deoxy-D-arabino-heptulosonate-7-phosphate synthase I beta [Thermosulfurimonas dismutans]